MCNKTLRQSFELKKFGLSKVSMFNFNRAVIESMLTFSHIVWFGNSTVQQRSQICNITQAVSKLLVVIFPLLMRSMSHVCIKTILKDPLHPARHLFTDTSEQYLL